MKIRIFLWLDSEDEARPVKEARVAQDVASFSYSEARYETIAEALEVAAVTNEAEQNAHVQTLSEGHIAMIEIG